MCDDVIEHWRQVDGHLYRDEIACFILYNSYANKDVDNGKMPQNITSNLTCAPLPQILG
jgi:hypothetical protein